VAPPCSSPGGAVGFRGSPPPIRFGKNSAATGRRWVVSRGYCLEPTRLTVNACASECCHPAPTRCAALRFAARPAACSSTPDPRVNVLPVSRKARPSCGSRLVPLHGTVLTRCKHRLAPYRRPQTHSHPLKATASPRLRRGPGEVAWLRPPSGAATHTRPKVYLLPVQ